MIAIGHGKPHLSQQQSGRWEASAFGYTCASMWGKLLAFQSPHSGQRPGPSNIWEFNALAPGLKDQIRFVAVYDSSNDPARRHRELVPWSWWDVHVVHRTLRLFAWACNRGIVTARVVAGKDDERH